MFDYSDPVLRSIECGMGNSGYLMTHERRLYVFDTLLMLVVLILLLVLQPAKYIPTKIERFGYEQNEELDSELRI